MDIEEIAQKLIDRKNKTPLDDFDGFSPEEMYTIVYFPFSKECPIQLNPALDNQILTHIPIFRVVLELVNAIDKNGGLKLTPKGNLPTKIVKEIYSKKYILDDLIEMGITKVQREENWIVLHTIKIVLNLSGITRKYKGKLVVTRQTKGNLENEEFSEIFYKFLQGYTTQFNWAYNDRFANEETGQIGCLYLLYLINKYGSTYRKLTFYTDLYLKAFPMFEVDGEEIEGIRYGKGEWVIEIRFFERFATWFGFIEIHYDKDNKYVARSIGIKKTEVLSNLLITNLHN